MCHIAKKESIRGYYVSGQKHCYACEIFIEWKEYGVLAVEVNLEHAPKI